MFSFSTYQDVPVGWIYFYYLGVTKPLDGRNIKLRSFLNNDSNPSLWLYVHKGMYRWKDFSSGQSGEAINVVMHMFKLSFKEAKDKVVYDYKVYTMKNGPYKPIEIDLSVEAYSFDAQYEVAIWAMPDREFWTNRFGISLHRVDSAFIRPLAWYQLEKIQGDQKTTYRKIAGPHIYGYFTATGKLYQIYQPYNKEMKFIKLERHIQGLDSLKYEGVALIIGSSLKDNLVTTNYDLKIEAIAPPSETTFLTKEEIDKVRPHYKYIFTLFDNDKAGVKSMLRYEKLYGIPFIYIPYEKDMAEFGEKSPREFVKTELTIRINKKIQCQSSLLTVP